LFGKKQISTRRQGVDFTANTRNLFGKTKSASRRQGMDSTAYDLLTMSNSIIKLVVIFQKLKFWSAEKSYGRYFVALGFAIVPEISFVPENSPPVL
jgi:hypothetical protein